MSFHRYFICYVCVNYHASMYTILVILAALQNNTRPFISVGFNEIHCIRGTTKSLYLVHLLKRERERELGVVNHAFGIFSN